MKRITYYVLAMGFVSLALGCQPAVTTDGDGEIPIPAETKAVAILCGSCGHEQGTDECCAEGAEVCADCELHKGSALCCKELGDAAGQDLCTGCGQVKGSEACCSEDGTECEKCGLHAGSPLCCKLEPEVNE